MSDQTDTNNETEPEKDTAEDSNSENSSSGNPTPMSRPVNPLSRPTDAIARPGFRNPANVRTKAQKGRKKKRRK